MHSWWFSYFLLLLNHEWYLPQEVNSRTLWSLMHWHCIQITQNYTNSPLTRDEVVERQFHPVCVLDGRACTSRVTANSVPPWSHVTRHRTPDRTRPDVVAKQKGKYQRNVGFFLPSLFHSCWGDRLFYIFFYKSRSFIFFLDSTNLIKM